MEGVTLTAFIREKERFEALFEYASMGILVANDKGIIEMANSHLLTQFGYSKEELLGKQVEMLIPRRYETLHQSHRKNYSAQPGKRPMGVGRDLYARRKDGSEFPVEVSLSNYQSNEGMFVIAFVIDITKRKEIENAFILQKEEIEDLNESLEQKVDLRTRQLQDAMEQLELSRDELSRALNKEKELGDLKSRFVSMASHEFRTPLSTILSSVSLLAKYTFSGEQDKRDKHINRIKSSVSNLTDILNEFLSIGKIEDGKVVVKYSEINLREFIADIVTEMKVMAISGQDLVYSHKGKEIVITDSSLLRNIIVNLLTNAIKFTREGGLIEISSKTLKDHFSITIKDNGIGISKADQEHLFERFFRASNATNIQGTGLGLHIVSRYAELLNGRISLESELEKGTAFTLTFNMDPV